MLLETPQKIANNKNKKKIEPTKTVVTKSPGRQIGAKLTTESKYGPLKNQNRTIAQNHNQ